MIRNACQPRPDFQETIRNQGLVYDTNADGSTYWREDAFYALTSEEVNRLYAAAKDLHQMFLAAAEHVLAQPNGLAKLEIPTPLHDVIRRSWEKEEWEFYGRFDLTLDRYSVPKLIEYNADTPTGLLEAAIIQWYWKEDRHAHADQFNSLHESLVGRWKELLAHRQVTKQLTHFSSVANHPEDRMTIGYIARTAEEAGFPVAYLPVDRIGWDRTSGAFVDEESRPIHQLFKLYPWEWMGTEDFAPQLGLAKWTVFEPAWKTIFASKMLLLVLQELYPKHPYLLHVADQPMPGDHVTKPTFGREGSHVALIRGGAVVDKREGHPDPGSLIYQQFSPLIQAGRGTYAQCGVWMVGPEPVGLGIREDTRPILSNTSQFVPHIIS